MESSDDQASAPAPWARAHAWLLSKRKAIGAVSNHCCSLLSAKVPPRRCVSVVAFISAARGVRVCVVILHCLLDN